MSIDPQRLGIAIRQRRGEHGLRDAIKEIGSEMTMAALSRLEGGRISSSAPLDAVLAWLGMSEDQVNAVQLPEPPSPERLTPFQWRILVQLCEDGVSVYTESFVTYRAVNALAGYGFVTQVGDRNRATDRGVAYRDSHVDEYQAKPARLSEKESKKWSEAWQNLNERQQRYLALFYQTDQDREKHERQAFNQRRQTRPASEWRWMAYNTLHGLWRDIERMGYRDKGTGSTLTALEKRGYILVKYERSDIPDKPFIYVQMTPKGRKLMRYGKHDEGIYP